jgi:hypothetical protein
MKITLEYLHTGICSLSWADNIKMILREICEDRTVDQTVSLSYWVAGSSINSNGLTSFTTRVC